MLLQSSMMFRTEYYLRLYPTDERIDGCTFLNNLSLRSERSKSAISKEPYESFVIVIIYKVFDIKIRSIN